MLLAGDIGGTKTLLGIFDPATPRPTPVVVRSYETLDFKDLVVMIGTFLKDEAVIAATRHSAIDRACYGVAGPVIDESAALTNVPWRVDGRRIASEFRLAYVKLLNDLQAMAYSVPELAEDEVVSLQRGEPVAGGNMALIAAGTGLGEALLHSVDGRFLPSPSEAGHADFSARTEREIVLLRDLTARHGRVDVEAVVSGRGLLNIHRVSHRVPCEGGIDLDDPHAPAAISAAAFEHRCAGCVETMDLFVEAYGAEAGNLAIRSLATAGVFLGGGIAPKILPALQDGRFIRAFTAKDPLASLMQSIPVKVILNADAGLLGAAVFASRIG